MVRMAACLHAGPCDRAADVLAAAFVGERLPPLWLRPPAEDLGDDTPDEDDLAEAAGMRCVPRPQLFL